MCRKARPRRRMCCCARAGATATRSWRTKGNTAPAVHAGPVVGALQAGKRVVCEKPFAITVDDVDRMIDAAAAHRRVLTVYQSRRWDPDYLAMSETIRSGRVGELFYMESFIGGGFHPSRVSYSPNPSAPRATHHRAVYDLLS